MSLLTQISNFGNNAAAVEKTLRLAQAYTLVGERVQPAIAAKTWVTARGQFNLARRYLRLTKWIDNFAAASSAFSSSKATVPKMLETAKFAFLGLYFIMEMFTITDVMGLTSLEFGPFLVIQSSRFWLYGLLCGMLQGVWEGLFEGRQSVVVSEKGVKGSKKGIATKNIRKGLPWKQLLVDGCDCFIPGAVTGWTPSDPQLVGAMMLTSTIFQLADMWAKIQAGTASVKPALKAKKMQ